MLKVLAVRSAAIAAHRRYSTQPTRRRGWRGLGFALLVVVIVAVMLAEMDKFDA